MPAGGEARPGTALAASVSPATQRLLVAGGALVGLLGLWALLDSLSSRVVGGNSDGATVVLEGAAMSGGNLALHGWAISLDSFWTLDAALNALFVRLLGVRPSLLNLVPAALAALVCAGGAFLGRDGRRGLAGWCGALTVLALLGLPGPDLAYYLLQGPWHVATSLIALSAFALLAGNRYDTRWLVAVALLAAGVLGDVFIVPIGLAPIGAAALATMAERRRLRADLPLLTAPLAALALAAAGRAVAWAAGTFTIVNRNLPVRSGQLLANVAHLGNRLPGMLGVGTIPETGGGDGGVGFELVHLLGLLAVLAGVLVALGGLAARAVTGRPGGGAEPAGAVVGGSTRLFDDLLVLAVLCDLLTFVFGAASDNSDYGKYLIPAVIFSAVLAGRLASRLTARLAGSERGARARTALIAAGVLVVASFAAEVGLEVGGPAAAQPASELSAFLAAHHLRQGVGDYWSSSIVTVESRVEVVVRPVSTDARGHLRRYERQSSLDWYEGQRFSFFVCDLARPWRNVTAQAAVATWGQPQRSYRVGTYQVLVWRHPFSVSTLVPRLGSPLKIFWTPGPPRHPPNRLGHARTSSPRRR